MTKQFSNYSDLLTFTRASKGRALRPVSYGDELVTNGDFSTDSDWNKQAGWTISGGTASYDGTGGTSSIRQDITANFKVGSVYQLSLRVLSNEGTGENTIYITSSQAINTTHFSVGTHVINFIPTSTNAYIFIYGRSGESFEIDNVSVKEVLFDQPDGTLTLFEHPANIPRVEWDSDRNRLGLLVEEARTNLVTYSEDFSNANWGKFDVTISSNTTASPDGTNNADKIIEGTGSSIHRINTAATIVSGTLYTASAFVKAGERSIVLLRTNNGSTDEDTYFDLSSGAVTSGSGSITDFGNGWFRVSRTFTASASTTSSFIYQILLVSSGTTTSYTGDGTSGAYVYGAQLEEGSFPTSYIKSNSGSTTTRSADVASIPVADFGYNQSAGTVVVEASKIGPSGNSYSNLLILREQSGGIANRAPDMGMGTGLSGNAGIFRVDVFDGGTAQATLGDLQSFSTNTFYKGGVALKENSMVSATNGSIGTEDTSGTVPYADVLEIGNRNGSQHMNGHIKSIKYYPRRLTNAQLQALTEPRSDATLSLTFDGLESSFTENYIHG